MCGRCDASTIGSGWHEQWYSWIRHSKGVPFIATNGSVCILSKKTAPEVKRRYV